MQQGIASISKPTLEADNPKQTLCLRLLVNSQEREEIQMASKRWTTTIKLSSNWIWRTAPAFSYIHKKNKNIQTNKPPTGTINCCHSTFPTSPHFSPPHCPAARVLNSPCSSPCVFKAHSTQEAALFWVEPLMSPHQCRSGIPIA